MEERAASGWSCFPERGLGRECATAEGGIPLLLPDSEESYAFLACARDEMSADPRPLLLDLAGVEHVTSTGVGIVAAIYKSAADANRAFALAGLSRRNEIILEVVQLLRFLVVFDDERAALEGYAADNWAPGT